jgi:hypothetical protein
MNAAPSGSLATLESVRASSSPKLCRQTSAPFRGTPREQIDAASGTGITTVVEAPAASIAGAATTFDVPVERSPVTVPRECMDPSAQAQAQRSATAERDTMEHFTIEEPATCVPHAAFLCTGIAAAD